MPILGERFYQISNAIFCYDLKPIPLAVYKMCIRDRLSRLHASKAILVFSAIVLKQGIPALPFRPQGNGAHFPAGAAFLVKRPATIFGVGTARQGKVSPAVFAHPHLHFPLDALPEVVVNEVIDHLRLQNLCKHFIVDELKANRLHTEPKGTVSCCLVVGDHFLRYRFLGLLIRIPVSYTHLDVYKRQVI